MVFYIGKTWKGGSSCYKIKNIVANYNIDYYIFNSVW